MQTAQSINETVKVIQRGLAGHLTYVAATAGWGTTSELALYPPIAAILMGQKWECRCQWVMSRKIGNAGAFPTIDFVARRWGSKDWMIAIEVKLLPTRRKSHEVKVEGDVAKLVKFKKSNKLANIYLLIAGRKKEIDEAYVLIDGERIYLRDRAPVIADLGRTAWGSVAIRL